MDGLSPRARERLTIDIRDDFDVEPGRLSLLYAILDYYPGQPDAGVENYRIIFTIYPEFPPAIEHNLLWLAVFFFIPAPFGLFLAFQLNKQLRGSRIYQSILFLPVVLSLFYGERTPHVGKIAAASVIGVIPVFAAAVFLQRGLVGGLTSGAVR